MVGYDLSSVTEGAGNPDKIKGSVLLLDNAAQSLGIIFAFSVLVGKPSPFTLQLYHVDVPGKTYRLGQEFNITPSVQKGREDVSQHSTVYLCMHFSTDLNPSYYKLAHSHHIFKQATGF